MSLLEVCHADVRDSIILDTEIKAYAARTATGGDGPSYLQRKRREYARELNKAKKMGDELLHSDADGRTIDPEASFRPTEKKKRAQKGTRKEKANRPKQNVATATSAGTENQDRPSHTILAPSSSSHVPVPVPPSANYGLAPASQPLPLFPLPNRLGSTDANCQWCTIAAPTFFVANGVHLLSYNTQQAVAFRLVAVSF